MTASDPRRGGRTARPRPGAGQSTRRASRGWHPETIVAAYLVPDEQVVLEETRSVRGFLAAKAGWLAALAVAMLLVMSVGQPALTGLAFLGALAVCGFISVQALQAWFTRYVLTDLRVLRVSGVLNRKAEFIPWGKVTDIGRTESLVQWFAHTATIRIESANERSAFRVINDIDDPERFYRKVVEMVDQRQGRVHPASTGR